MQTNSCFKTTWSDESKDCDSTVKSVSSEDQKLNLMTIRDDSDDYKKQPSWESIIISPDLIDNRQINKLSDLKKKYLITKKVIRSNIQHIPWISVVIYNMRGKTTYPKTKFLSLSWVLQYTTAIVLFLQYINL